MIKIGIDPDVDKSGICVFSTNYKKIVELKNEPFFTILEILDGYQLMFDVVVYVEAGWLINKSNWHKDQGQLRRERIAKNVGANHQIGKLFEQYCIEQNISYKLIKPKGKIDAKRFKMITGWAGRTNQDMRDACMLVFDN